MSDGTKSTGASSDVVSVLKKKSNDVGWEYKMLIDPKNMDKVKCKNAIVEAKSRKKNKEEDLMTSSINISEKGKRDDEDELQELGSKKTPHTLGPMDRFASSISPEASAVPVMTKTTKYQ